jgi:hypothetical protein
MALEENLPDHTDEMSYNQMVSAVNASTRIVDELIINCYFSDMSSILSVLQASNRKVLDALTNSNTYQGLIDESGEMFSTAAKYVSNESMTPALRIRNAVNMLRRSNIILDAIISTEKDQRRVKLAMALKKNRLNMCEGFESALQKYNLLR